MGSVNLHSGWTKIILWRLQRAIHFASSQVENANPVIVFYVQNVFYLLLFSQAITYALCVNELGKQEVHKYEGREPSGRKFNEIALDHQSKTNGSWDRGG